MKVEIWSDVVCPWCYIGKRRFESALARFDHRDEVQVTWRSFELDPGAPRIHEGDPAARLAAKYGIGLDQARAFQDQMTEAAAGEGLAFHLDRARSGNTFDAHRLLHLAAEERRQDALEERLFAAYLSEGRAIGDGATLAELAGEVGIDPDQARNLLGSDTHADQVRAEEAEASALGITGVPFFVFDRTYGVSGAQAPDLLLEALGKAWAGSRHLVTVGPAGAVGAVSRSDGGPAGDDGGPCRDGSCVVD